MNARQYTLQELWGGSLEEHPKKAKKRKLKLYCIYLGDGQYYATNGHEPFVVFGMENADVFLSLEEANDFLRTYWIQGEVVEYRGRDKDMLLNAYR